MSRTVRVITEVIIFALLITILIAAFITRLLEEEREITTVSVRERRQREVVVKPTVKKTTDFGEVIKEKLTDSEFTDQAFVTQIPSDIPHFAAGGKSSFRSDLDKSLCLKPHFGTTCEFEGHDSRYIKIGKTDISHLTNSQSFNVKNISLSQDGSVTCSQLADQKSATFFNITDKDSMLICDLYFDDFKIEGDIDYDINTKDGVYLNKCKPVVVDGAYFFKTGQEITLNNRYFDDEMFNINKRDVVFVRKGEEEDLPFVPVQIITDKRVVLKNKDDEELIYEATPITVVNGVVRTQVVKTDIIGLTTVRVE